MVGVFWGAWSERDTLSSQQNFRELVEIETDELQCVHLNFKLILAETVRQRIVENIQEKWSVTTSMRHGDA